jgi:hypothetical protein
MIGVGPGANLRKKSFEALQKQVVLVANYLKSHPQPTKDDIKGFHHHFELLKKDVKLYCGDFQETKEYQACYDRTMVSLDLMQKQSDPAKFATTSKAEVPKLNRQVTYMAHAAYFEPKAANVAPAAPQRPATPAPAAPPRPSSASPTKS